MYATHLDHENDKLKGSTLEVVSGIFACAKCSAIHGAFELLEMNKLFLNPEA